MFELFFHLFDDLLLSLANSLWSFKLLGQSQVFLEHFFLPFLQNFVLLNGLFQVCQLFLDFLLASQGQISLIFTFAHLDFQIFDLFVFRSFDGPDRFQWTILASCVLRLPAEGTKEFVHFLVAWLPLSNRKPGCWLYFPTNSTSSLHSVVILRSFRFVLLDDKWLMWLLSLLILYRAFSGFWWCRQVQKFFFQICEFSLKHG